MLESLIILTSVMGAAFFSGTETALIGLGPLHAVKTAKREKMLRLYHNRNRLIATCLVGTNITIIAATIALHRLLSGSYTTYAKAIAFICEIAVFFVLAEVLPKTIFRRLGIFILEWLYFPVRISQLVFWPLTASFLFIAKVFFRVLPEKSNLHREDLFYFVKANLSGDTQVAENLLKLGTTTVKEVMTPLVELYSLEMNSAVKDAIAMLKTTFYSRFPVYHARGDHIVGYVEVDSFLESKPSDKMQALMKDACYFPESLKVDRALFQMQEMKIPLAFVVNEYGGVIGMMTLEDIAELLVGDIFISEQQQEAPYAEMLQENRFRLNPIIDIDDFNEFFSLKIEKEGYEAPGGFLLSTLDKFPAEKEVLRFYFGQFTIEKADKKSIISVIFEKNS